MASLVMITKPTTFDRWQNHPGFPNFKNESPLRHCMRMKKKKNLLLISSLILKIAFVPRNNTKFIASRIRQREWIAEAKCSCVFPGETRELSFLLCRVDNERLIFCRKTNYNQITKGESCYDICLLDYSHIKSKNNIIVL